MDGVAKSSPIGTAPAAAAVSVAASSRTLELRRGEKHSPELAKLEQMAAGFEAVFADSLLGELMQPMEEGGGLAGEGPGASIVQGLLQSNLSDHLAKSGGFGIAKLLLRQMAPQIHARPQSRNG